MSSVRIEGAALVDLRFDRLAALCGLADADHARGKMVRLWSQCTAERRYQLVPEDVNAVLGPNGVDALISARLGERNGDMVRICGTRGRIEWLENLRKNGKKGGRPKKTKWKPSGSQELNPLAPVLVTAPAPAPVHEEAEPPKPPKGGSVGSRRKAKPTDLTETERASAAVVLDRLGRRTGIGYGADRNHLHLIACRLREGVTERELRGIVAYCWTELGWEAKPEMHQYLRPETLFGPKTISKYLPGARKFLAENFPETAPETLSSEPSPIAADLFARQQRGAS